MNVSKIGVTRIVPITDELQYSKIYRNFFLNGTIEIRERLLKDGSKIIIGYNEGSKFSNFIQQITPEGWIKKEKYYSKDIYGEKKEKTELQLEKNEFNKIGDMLRNSFQIKTFENNNLIEFFKSTMDIFAGKDFSEKTFYPNKEGNTPKGYGKIIKNRISPCEYTEETYDTKGKLLYRQFAVINDKEGDWKF